MSTRFIRNTWKLAYCLYLNEELPRELVMFFVNHLKELDLKLIREWAESKVTRWEDLLMQQGYSRQTARDVLVHVDMPLDRFPVSHEILRQHLDGVL